MIVTKRERNWRGLHPESFSNGNVSAQSKLTCPNIPSFYDLRSYMLRLWTEHHD